MPRTSSPSSRKQKKPRTEPPADKQAVFFGELLLRLATPRHERFVQAHEFQIAYTGAEANAAVCAANFGVQASVVSAVPGHEIGQACVDFLRRFGVGTDHIVRTGSRLGVFYLESGASQRPSKVIYDRAGSAFAKIQPGDFDWDRIFDGRQWFHWSGTAPALGANVAAVTREACQAAKRHGLTVSCDLNYRRKLWTPAQARKVMTGLMPFVDVLIGGRGDASLVLGVEAAERPAGDDSLDVDTHRAVARELHRRFGFQLVATTLRESFSASENNLSCLLSDGKEAWMSDVYRMQIIDRVGGGDAFSGALIYALLAGMERTRAISFAAAAACLKHTIHGDFNHVSIAEVEALMSGRDGGRIQR
jgi:2-dehydro-3-deoxygluconokinase